jgi:hypothetical protein
MHIWECAHWETKKKGNPICIDFSPSQPPILPVLDFYFVLLSILDVANSLQAANCVPNLCHCLFRCISYWRILFFLSEQIKYFPKIKVKRFSQDRWRLCTGSGKIIILYIIRHTGHLFCILLRIYFLIILGLFLCRLSQDLGRLSDYMRQNYKIVRNIFFYIYNAINF